MKYDERDFDAMLENWLARQGETTSSVWAQKLLEQAVAQGLTDGTRPQAFATRQEVAIMLMAAQEKQ